MVEPGKRRLTGVAHVEDQPIDVTRQMLDVDRAGVQMFLANDISLGNPLERVGHHEVMGEKPMRDLDFPVFDVEAVGQRLGDIDAAGFRHGIEKIPGRMRSLSRK